MMTTLPRVGLIPEQRDRCPDGELVNVGLEPAFAVDCGHTPGSGGGNGLAVDVVLDVAAGKNAFDVGERAVVGHEVTVFVGGELTSEEVGVWPMADGHEDAGDGKRTFFTGNGVGERDTLDCLFALNGGHR